jgi:sugar O-acyltransferase (sialic acid O-acetyltransferase NeuD family)
MVVSSARQDVVIFGTGDQARLTHSYLLHDSVYRPVAFTVHADYVTGDSFCGLEVIPFDRVEERYPPDRVAMFVAVAFGRVNRTRAEVYAESKRKGYRLVSYVSTCAVVGPDFVIGDNSVLLEGSIVQPFARIGNDVVIGPGCLIGHDVVIGDHCFLAAGVTIPGNVTIGDYCFIGANATFRNGINIAAECVIGAGALVLENTEARQVFLEQATPAAAISSDMLSPFFGGAPGARPGRHATRGPLGAA